MYSPIIKLWLVPALLLGATAAPAPVADVLETREKWAFQQSTLGLRAFAQAGCGGNKALQNPVIYGHNNEPGNITSYSLGRPLQAGEQLDFSTFAPTDVNTGIDKACNVFTSSVVAGQPGSAQGTCFNLGATSNCYRLTMK